MKYSRNPVFEEGFMFLVTNPEVEDLNLKVYDERSKSVLGLLRLNLGDLLLRNGMEYLNQPFKLNTQVNTGESVVILSLQLFVTKKVMGRRKISRGVSENDTISVVSFGDNDSDPMINYSRVSAIAGPKMPFFLISQQSFQIPVDFSSFLYPNN